MNTKDLLREICEYAKANGEKLTRKQARVVLEALREISIETCKKGEKINLRKFLIIEGVLTSARRLPNGEMSVPRMKMRVEVTDSLKEEFKKDVMGEE